MQLSLMPLQNNDVIRVRATGPLTLRQTEVGADPLQNLLGEHCYTLRVLLDLENCLTADSSGVGWLVGAHKRFVQANGKLVVHSAQPLVSQVFTMMQLTSLLAIANDERSARELALDSRTDHEPGRRLEADGQPTDPAARSMRLSG
jgi:anti-anti-sigma factor